MDGNSIVLVIVYRDRPRQLGEFLETVSSFLSKRGFDWRIIISEQCPDTPFNRGLLINLGYVSGRILFPKFRFTVFTDVDIYPVERDDSLDYSGIKGYVRHIFCGFEQNVGGVVNFDNELFEKINGFPNHLWGWGHEDFATKRRLDKHNISVDRSTTVYRDRSEDRERFRMYDHHRDKQTAPINQQRAYEDNVNVSGLSSLPKYRETRIHLTDRIVRCIYHFDKTNIF